MDVLNTKIKNIKLEKTLNVRPENIKSGATIFGISGSSTVVNTSDANATAANILSTKTAYVNGSKLTGSMTNNGSLSYTPSDSSQTIPAGYTSGGTIAAMDITTSQEYQTALVQSEYLLTGGNPYDELQYIEVNTGAPYIDTGYKHKADTKVEIKFQATSYNNSQYIALMGARQSNMNNYSYNFFTKFNYSLNFCYSRTRKEVQNTGMYNTPVTLTTYQNTATYTDGTTTRTISAGGTLDAGTNNFLLFNLNTGGANAVSPDSSNTAGNRIYYCKIWDDDGVTLVRDFIPVKRVRDNAICFYDKVTQEYFIKQGTGTFLAGPVKE